jgi:hypothetical protein
MFHNDQDMTETLTVTNVSDQALLAPKSGIALR